MSVQSGFVCRIALDTISVIMGYIMIWQKSGRLVVVGRVPGLLELFVYLGAVIICRTLSGGYRTAYMHREGTLTRQARLVVWVCNSGH